MGRARRPPRGVVGLDCRTDAAGSTGHDGDLAFERSHETTPSSTLDKRLASAHPSLDGRSDFSRKGVGEGTCDSTETSVDVADDEVAPLPIAREAVAPVYAHETTPTHRIGESGKAAIVPASPGGSDRQRPGANRSGAPIARAPRRNAATRVVRWGDGGTLRCEPWRDGRRSCATSEHSVTRRNTCAARET